MSGSRQKAIRITIITVAVSMLLGLVCCAAFVLNLAGLAQNEQLAAPDNPNVSVSIVWCASEDGPETVCYVTA